jgi:hypothetical protein
LLSAAGAAYLEALGASFVAITGELDETGAYRAWFQSRGCTVALVRPDFYVFGTASDAEQTDALVGRLESALQKQAIREETPTG